MSNTPENKIGFQIVQFEASSGDSQRRDSNGYIKAYLLPSNDGGAGNGINYEFAGINGKYHAEQVIKLKGMQPSAREAECARYIENYARTGTGVVAGLVREGTALFVLDSAFNRGAGGACVIVQDALNRLGFSSAAMGGAGWGSRTRAALAIADKRYASRLVNELRRSRERYEDARDAEKGARPNLRNGLVNRWNKCAEISHSWNKSQSSEVTPRAVQIILPRESDSSLNKFYGLASEGGANLDWFNFPVDNVTLYSETGPELKDRDGDGNDEHRCHVKVIEPLEAALAEIYKTLGKEEFERQGWNIYAGCFNYRRKTSGSSLSTHSWGIAVDINPDKNGWKQYSTSFSSVAIDIMEKYGFLSAGRAWGHDYMHFQRAIPYISAGSYYDKNGLPKHIVSA